MLISKLIMVGGTISFDYDNPGNGPIRRVGQLIRMYRAKKKDRTPLYYVIIDQTAGGEYRQFRYSDMRNIQFTPSYKYQPGP